MLCVKNIANTVKTGLETCFHNYNFCTLSFLPSTIRADVKMSRCEDEKM